MTEITEDMVQHAKRVCQPTVRNQIVAITEDTAIGITAGGGAGGLIGNMPGALVGGALGGLLGLRTGIKAATTPDIDCVTNILKQNSSARY